MVSEYTHIPTDFRTAAKPSQLSLVFDSSLALTIVYLNVTYEIV